MRKIYLLACSLFVLSSVRAQNPALPNPGFENWHNAGNHVDPDNWNTLNPSTGIIGVLTATRATGADVHSGSYAIRLQTKSVFGTVANGIASTGTIITTPPYGVTGGIPYTGRPDSIAGWYKYTPAGTDSGFVEFILKGHQNDSVGYVRFVTPNAVVSTYTRFSAKINYTSTTNPDTALWILSSSRGSNPVVNSTIIIDDLQLIFNPIVCNVPQGTTVSNITTNSAKLKWSAVTGAINYQQKYRVLGTTSWTYKTTTNLVKPLTGLLPGTTYEWAVHAKCSSNPVVWSNWSPKKNFTTATTRTEAVAVPDEQEMNELFLYPNPADDLVNLSMMAERDELVHVTVYNAIGQQVSAHEFLTTNGILNEQIDVSALRSGIYMVTLDGSSYHTTRRLLVH